MLASRAADQARARPLITDGQVDARALRRELMGREELIAELRLHGVTDVKDVARRYIEVTRELSVIRADRAEADAPVTPPVAR